MARRKKATEDQPNENTENVNESDDNFGLPEIEYEPLNRDEVVREVEVPTPTPEPVYKEEEVVKEEVIEEPVNESFGNQEPPNEYTFNQVEEEEPSSAPKIIAIIVILLLAAGAAWYFMVYQPKKKAEAERARKEAAASEEFAKKQNEQRLAELKRQEDEKRRADSLANAAPKEGSIETLTGRSGRYFVVVASAIDDDLIMDYAKKLSAKGVNAKIIPPFGKVKFFRIAVAEGDTYADAQSTADGLKSEYSEGAWVVKY